MISAGVEGRLPYMTYPEPWRGPPKQPPEFLRPPPKPVPPTRFNGTVTTSTPNGTRLGPIQRPVGKYSSATSLQAPVNLTQHKDDVADELAYHTYSRLYQPYTHYPTFPNIYQSPYPALMRSTYPPTTPLPPLETYSLASPTTITSSTFLSPTFSPPSATIKPGQSILRDKRTPPESIQPTPQQQQMTQQQAGGQQQHHVAFKVPSGKEGSLKHRILTRPEEAGRNNSGNTYDLQKSPSETGGVRKRLSAINVSPPPKSPKKMIGAGTTGVIPGCFAKGSLIQLANGELKKLEDMRTEDFISSAERSTDYVLAHSTVVRIGENHVTGIAAITLSYNHRRTQMEIESTVEHPYFVIGQGWASCNPDRTQQCYGLKVHRLQVGDVLIILTPKETTATLTKSRPSGVGGGTTIMTTATTTAMSVRQTTTVCPQPPSDQPIDLHAPSPMSPPSTLPDTLASRKRRCSAPDQIRYDDVVISEQNARRHRIE